MCSNHIRIRTILENVERDEVLIGTKAFVLDVGTRNVRTMGNAP